MTESTQKNYNTNSIISSSWNQANKCACFFFLYLVFLHIFLVLTVSPLQTWLRRYLIPNFHISLRDKSSLHSGSHLKYLDKLSQSWYGYDSQNNTGQCIGMRKTYYNDNLCIYYYLSLTILLKYWPHCHFYNTTEQVYNKHNMFYELWWCLIIYMHRNKFKV